MSTPLDERRLAAEQSKLSAARERILGVAYLKPAEVQRHLNLSRTVLSEIPMEVLPWTPGPGAERVSRRYHPADVLAYPARARRWRAAREKGEEAEAQVLAAMRAELEERDRAEVEDALSPRVA